MLNTALKQNLSLDFFSIIWNQTVSVRGSNLSIQDKGEYDIRSTSGVVGKTSKDQINLHKFIPGRLYQETRSCVINFI